MATKTKEQPDTLSRFELDGEILEFDISTLTFGEIEYVETYFDKPYEEIPWESGRGMLMIATLAKARKKKIPLTAAAESLRDVAVSSIEEAKPERPSSPKA